MVDSKSSRTTLFKYDFKNNVSSLVGTFDNMELTLAIPHLSNSGQSMIGVDYEDKSRDYDDNWYVMYVDTMAAIPILVPPNIAATDSIEWSPNDDTVALVGFYRDDENPYAGALRCKKVVLIYDPMAQVIEYEVKVPDNRCYSPIDLYRDSIWSPDSSKLALVLDQQDICIISVSDGGRDCAAISNNFGTEYKIRSLAWSPDSRYLAFRGFNGKVQVYSIEDRTTNFIVDTHDLSSSPVGNNLVWGPQQ